MAQSNCVDHGSDQIKPFLQRLGLHWLATAWSVLIALAAIGSVAEGIRKGLEAGDVVRHSFQDVLLFAGYTTLIFYIPFLIVAAVSGAALARSKQVVWEKPWFSWMLWILLVLAAVLGFLEARSPASHDPGNIVMIGTIGFVGLLTASFTLALEAWSRLRTNKIPKHECEEACKTAYRECVRTAHRELMACWLEAKGAVEQEQCKERFRKTLEACKETGEFCLEYCRQLFDARAKQLSRDK